MAGLLTREDVAEWFEGAEDALATGGEFEFAPDTIDGADEWCEYCDDCDAFHRYWLVDGVRIEEGVIYHTLYHCDEDGDWGFSDECDIESEGYMAWLDEISEEKREESWREYYAHTAQTGEDPLGVFFLGSPLRVEVPWEFEVAERDGQVVLVHARRKGAEKWTTPRYLSKRAREFFNLGKGDVMQDFASVAELKEVCSTAQSADTTVEPWTATISEDRGVRDRRKKLRQRAMHELALLPAA